jgi:hypothetical protein
VAHGRRAKGIFIQYVYYCLGEIYSNKILDGGASESGRNDSWLRDARGKQVTPSVGDQPTESGIAKFNNKKRFIKRRDSNGEVYIEPIGSEAYVKAQEPTDGDGEDVQMDMGDDNNKKSGISVVLKPLKFQEMYQKVSETGDNEGNGMGYGSAGGLAFEMETD